MLHIPVEEKFWNNVIIGSEDSCWLWVGGISGSGYGNTRTKGKNMTAHRLSYIIHFGEIPSNKMVLHRCDNKLCVNPNHLFIGTANDNIQDMISKSRDNYKTLKGKKFSDSHRLNLSLAHTGHRHSDETKEKISNNSKIMWARIKSKQKA